MVSRNLGKRLARLEMRLGPGEQRVLKIVATRMGGPDEIIEVRLHPPGSRRRRQGQETTGRL
jgi:hypothetical protein